MTQERTNSSPYSEEYKCDTCIRGETLEQPCGEDLERIKAVLSAVRDLNFRFGPHRIAQILKGSRVADILDRGLDQQRQFGALKSESAPWGAGRRYRTRSSPII